MPHVVVKMMSGRSDELKQKLSDALVETMKHTLGVDGDSLSVAIEDVAREDWMDKVFEPEIKSNQDKLFKEPGYKNI